MGIRRSVAISTAVLLVGVAACGRSGSGDDDALKGGTVPGRGQPVAAVAPVAGAPLPGMSGSGTPTVGLATMCVQGVPSGSATATLPSAPQLPGVRRPTAQIEVGDLAVDEAAGIVKVPVTLSGTNPFLQEFHVQFGWQTVNETATSPSDFTGVTNGVIDFVLNGAAAKTANFRLVQEVQVKVTEDGIPEVDSMWRMGTETFGVSVAPCKGSTVLLKKPKGTIKVTDNDGVFDLLGQGGAKREAIDSYLMSVAAMEAYAPDSNTGLSMPAYRTAYLDDLYAKRKANVIFGQSSLTSDDVFVFTTNKAVVVAFRGTQQVPFDAATDLMLSFTPTGYSFTGNGLEFAHNGFWAAVRNLYPALLPAVKAEVAKGKKVYVTGHSLGGAMASAFAFRAAKDGVPIEFVSTFGSPRVFNGNAAKDYSSMGLSARTMRWVFDDDIVTQIPSTLALTALCAAGTFIGYVSYVGAACASALASIFDEPFWHVGQVRHVVVADENKNCSSISLQALPEVLPPTSEDFEPEDIGISDHSMARYVNSTYRFVGSPIVPPAPKNTPPTADDARFDCKEID